MLDWTYFSPAQLRFPFLRRRKQIGWSEAKQSHFVQVCELMTWKGSADLLETMACQQLAWLTKQDMSCQWSGVLLSNGAGYLQPDLDGPLRCTHPDRYVDVMMTQAAAGICITFMLLSRLQNTRQAMFADSKFYRKLYSFGELHPEFGAIHKVLD